LPDAKELQSLLDYSRSPATTNSAANDPICNAMSFINEGGRTDWPWYWTLTTQAIVFREKILSVMGNNSGVHWAFVLTILTHDA
jgi:hypothetical protein